MKAEEILRKYLPPPTNEGEKNDDINILKAMQEYAILKESEFKIGDYIKRYGWKKYKVKIIDIGSFYFIVEKPDGTLGHSEIDNEWFKA